MANELLAACALVLVIEGILPFASPRTVRKLWENIATMPDSTLRIFGLVSMLVGVVLLTLIR
ncbi:MAG: DUF2065 domain-containing protein [Gammaproteobacteria bacterium]